VAQIISEVVSFKNALANIYEERTEETLQIIECLCEDNSQFQTDMVPLLSAATKDLKLLRILTFRNENLTDLLAQDLLKTLLQIKPTSKQDITDVIQICFSISRVSHQLTEEQFK
jgi:hypothetical protein